MSTGMSVEGVRGALRALLAGMGGGCLRLRMPGPAASGDSTEEIGLATPQFQDVPVSPVSVRATAEGSSVLVEAEVLRVALGAPDAGSVDARVAEAESALVGEERFAIERVESLEMGGGVYGYRVGLRRIAGA